MPTPRSIYGGRRSSADSCAVRCNETDALAALETMIGLLEEVVKYYPPATYFGTRFGKMDVDYRTSPLIYFRLAWKNTYKVPFTASVEQTYQLLDLYVAANMDWNADPMIGKLVDLHKIDAPVFPYEDP